MMKVVFSNCSMLSHTLILCRYKNLPFLNESEKGKVLQDVETMVMDHLSAVEDRDVEERPSEEIENESLPPRKKKSLVH